MAARMVPAPAENYRPVESETDVDAWERLNGLSRSLRLRRAGLVALLGLLALDAAILVSILVGSLPNGFGPGSDVRDVAGLMLAFLASAWVGLWLLRLAGMARSVGQAKRRVDGAIASCLARG